ncbi:MAG: sigma-70 family RNA polymerase sigma factor [Nitrosarchaeum sp.]|nr:sigma-70 family RNA polymerase sigma factor [Nitrosarchaeum sp.]
MTQRTLSLDECVDNHSGGKVYEAIPDPQPSPEDAVLVQRRLEDIRAALRSIPEREQIIIRYRFGLGDAEELTLDAIGKLLELSRERVRQLQNEALGQLRERLRASYGGRGMGPDLPSYEERWNF